MWNGGPKMSGISAKIYSIWNGGSHVESMWNPCGMRSIPCGVHVECGGRVKTSKIRAIADISPVHSSEHVPLIFIHCACSDPTCLDTTAGGHCKVFDVC